MDAFIESFSYGQIGFRILAALIKVVLLMLVLGPGIASILTWLEERKLSGKLGGWLKKAAPLRGAKAIEFHKTCIYLAKLLGFEIVGSIQPKPGVEPGPKHVEELKSLDEVSRAIVEVREEERLPTPSATVTP